MRVRPAFNRLVVAFALVIGLPVVAGAERLRVGSGRRVLARLVRVISRGTGVRITRAAGGGPPLPLASGRPVVLVANHSSLADIPALLSVVPELCFVAAADLYRFPLLGRVMKAMGTVAVDRRNPRQARRVLADLAEGGLPGLTAVFPEGGIPDLGEGRRLKTGAFSLAITAGALVVPVAIHGSRQVLAPGARLAVRPGRVEVEFLEPLDAAGLAPNDRRRLRDRAEAAIRAALADRRQPGEQGRGR